MPLNLVTDSKITRVENAAVAAQTAVDTDVLDMSGYDSVTFVALLGDVDNGSVLGLTIQHGDLANGSDQASTTAAATWTADATNADNKVLIVEAVRPIKRYVRARLTRTTANAALDGIVAIQTGPAYAPGTQGDTVIASAAAMAPATA